MPYGGGTLPTPPRSKDRPAGLGRLGCQRKSGLRLYFAIDQRGDVLPHRRAMLEPVTRTTAHQPDMFEIRMPVDQEITRRCVLVLADARFHQGRSSHAGKSLG